MVVEQMDELVKQMDVVLHSATYNCQVGQWSLVAQCRLREGVARG